MPTTDLHALADSLRQVLDRAAFTAASYSVDSAEIAFQMLTDQSAREGIDVLKRAGYRCKRRHYPGAAPEIVVTVR
jgi:hypothetical protein